MRVFAGKTLVTRKALIETTNYETVFTRMKLKLHIYR